ncbi:SusC/RagA family TonB-linked outer membrane protein [Arundinibacter roseus]|uniref:TonB-dependent receptor n=1 Tax=Arundinibacter roseus TaxID=2070510 RepID=A0A4R4K5G0_9BACT|nr:TonB-dependent receptor [Arundinibacter roseus]TDB62697.1 TonB-dependent receptor [Arundinibacter roseus]
MNNYTTFLSRAFLLFSLLIGLGLPQVIAQKVIRGKIVDEQNQAVPGANVFIKGSTVGTSSMADGTYSITADSGDILVFSFLGYQSSEQPVGESSTININLEPDARQLADVVVIGYGSVKKSDLTGSLSSVTAKDFEKQPLTKIDEALQGRAAGVQVTQTSGAPGSGFKIRIRGANSISGDNSPLYVLDGLVVGDINSLNVNDIASMEVLKDASATAIYGSRGANGVVLITTKKGRKGPAQIEVGFFTGVSNVAQKLDLMSPAEFALGVNFAENRELYTADEIAALRVGAGENWQNRFFRTAPFSNTQLSMSGGSENFDYFVSGNLNSSKGTLIDQDYKRYTLRANFNAQVSKKIRLGLNSFISHEKATGVRAELSTGLTWDPTTPAFDAQGNYNFAPLKPGVGNAAPNPLLIPENNTRENFEDRLTLSGFANYDILKNLTLNISGGVDRFTTNNNGYTPILVNNIGSATVFNQTVTRIQNTNRLTYALNKNPNHSLTIDAVHEQQLVIRSGNTSFASNFFSDQTTYKNLSLGSIQRTMNTFSDESLQSFLGRVNYSLLNRFLVTASVRADGSSKFRKDNRWGVFPSGSVAWKLAEEEFIKNIPAISDLKVRVSYGVIGSQAIGPLATRATPVISPDVNYPFTGNTATIGVAPSERAANPDLTWETTRQANIGLDLGLFNSALTLSVDLYKKNTTDLLLNAQLPSFLGPTLITRNVGEVENKGFDISLGWNMIRTDDWDVRSSLNVSRNKNEVLALVDGQPLELGAGYVPSTFSVNPTRVEVGMPISSFRGYIFEGVYQLGEESEAAKFNRRPGDAKYRDINRDGLITTDDITNIGTGNPNFTWGWNWDITYKNFNLNFLITGSQGNDIYNFQRGRMMALGAQQFHAVHQDYIDRWTPTNPSNIPSGRNGTELLSSQFLEDGSYATLKNAALSYNFDNSLLQKIGISKLRLYVSSNNLLILTGYRGFDPESTASGNSDIDLGIDYDAYPINRTFTLGLNLTF